MEPSSSDSAIRNPFQLSHITDSSLLIYIFKQYFIYLWRGVMRRDVPMQSCTWRTTCGSWFAYSIMWVPEIELRLLGLVVRVFTFWTSCQPIVFLKKFFSNRVCCSLGCFGTYSGADHDLELQIFLLVLPKCQDCRHVPLYLTISAFLLSRSEI